MEVLQAEEAIRTAETIRVAVAAAIGQAGLVEKNSADNLVAQYQKWHNGKMAVIEGSVGFDVDEMGTPILRSADDIREWFARKGSLKV